ncbi:NADPH dependent diflavin oxidoreductase-like protein 1 [Pyronema domesticum]|uniref:NADPH-dependent diflavin oxidoreductase 1 n=1 Tax=Pyronema omphalodes (strain CBS 100304) TaxID=1076935 RepID=U4LUW9_PYROM|nr:NADPH dependent diflavin oxidoreductase-like protein 1 [Pyronema domesticum]CCX34077.1 Similar to Probable NADPH reductase tah18; acc. no. Q5BB41 [Pyronema omphalodes CBS 100304]
MASTAVPTKTYRILPPSPAPRRKALVLYASQTGTAEDLSLQLSNVLQRHLFTVTSHSCDEFTPFSSLPSHDLVFFIISTTGQGEIPDNAKLFWRNLLRKKLPPNWLERLNFAVFCLGDSTYPKFCWAGRKVGRRLLQLGAKEVLGRGEGDQSGDEGIDGAFAYWVDELRNGLRVKYPIPLGMEEIPEDVLLPPKWILEFADEDPTTPTNGTSNGTTNGTSVTNGATNGINTSPSKPKQNPAHPLPPIPAEHLHAPRPGNILATVSSNTRLTPPSHFQDVRHLSLSLPLPISWQPGDTLSILPKNFPQDVDHFLELQSWTHLADRPLRLLPHPSLSPDAIPPCPISTPVTPLTLRTLLTHHLDITSIPRRSFFLLAASLTSDATHAERLAEFADPQWVEELYDYTTRPRRSLLEVLQEFNTIRIGLDRLLELVPRLRERHFSIASSSLVNPRQVELLVAIVRYKTIIKRIREGVCTRYLASLNSGDEINIVFARGGLLSKPLTDEELSRPVVMISPGTGLAPMRTLIQHRIAMNAIGSNLLFFGARNRDADYFFCSEFEDLQNRGKLQLYTAFSRDQKQKRYVQTVIREQGREVWDALGIRGGAVYVCGSSGRMPQAVREALMEVAERWGGLKREEARAWLEALEKGGRYRQETW